MQIVLVLVNSMRTPEELKELAKIDGGIVAVVDATQIALKKKQK